MSYSGGNEPKKSRFKDNLVIIIIFGTIIGSISMAVVQPYFEANSYNKLTGGNATYWDAFWSELRIDGDR